MEQIQQISGTVVDVINRRMFGGCIEVGLDGRIRAIRAEAHPQPGYILPGLVDAHVHVESSMLCPAAFARTAVCYGTIAAVTDPHEIANVLGMAGVEFMVTEARRAHRFTLPSVPLPAYRPRPLTPPGQRWMQQRWQGYWLAPTSAIWRR